MSQKIDDTILKMVKDLKGNKTEQPFIFGTPSLKRTASSTSDSIDSSLGEGTPAKRSRRDTSLDLSYIASPREARRLRFDLVETRNTVKCLEERISDMHNVRIQLELLFKTENDSTKRQHEYDKKCIEELEKNLQIIRKRENELKKDHLELQKKYRNLKLNSDDELIKLEKELSDIKEESRTYETDDDMEASKLQRKVMELESMLATANENVDSHKKLVDELTKQLAEKNGIESELEQKNLALIKTKNQMKEMEYVKENYIEYQEQSKTQAQKLLRYVELEKENKELNSENARLKSEIGNKLLLEAEVHDMKTRLSKFKKIEKDFTELQVKSNQNDMYLNEFRAVARNICETIEEDALLPQLLRQVVERLQQQELKLTSEKVEIESQLNSIQHAAKLAKMELEKNHTLLTELKQTNEQRQSIIHRMQKKIQLVTRERDSYRAQLDSYEKDLTIVVTSGPGSAVQTQNDRIESLEKIVEGYRDMVTKLENDLQNVQPDMQVDLVPVKAEQMRRLEERVRKLQEQNTQLREAKDRLEIQLENYLEGHDSLLGGNVLHMANNPLSECLAEREKLVENLQQEVVRLKNKIKKLEEGIETSKLGDISICPKEVQSLKEKLSSQEKQTQKLKDHFKSTTQEFRNVIYMLLGYKIDKPKTSNLYRLTSMYAEKPEDQLYFAVTPDGDLNLMDSEFSATLEPLIDLHLRDHKSIPMFLSAITMDLFNSRTLSQTFA